MNKNCILLLVFICFLNVLTIAQSHAPGIKLQKSLGGDGADGDYSVQIEKESDGGFVLAMSTESYRNGDVMGTDTASQGRASIWITRLDASLNIIWSEVYGSSENDVAGDIIKTPDGGYMIVGTVEAGDGSVSGFHGEKDAWVLKLSASGKLEWQKCFGGSFDDAAHGILPTPDGSGYVIYGRTNSADGDITDNTATPYAEISWLFKINSAGTLQWSHTIKEYEVNRLKSAPDGNFVFATKTGTDNVLVKLDGNGNVVWQKIMDTKLDGIGNLAFAPDGGYYIVGITGFIQMSGNSQFGTVAKVNEEGKVQWKKSLGGYEVSSFYQIEIQDDNNILVGGMMGAWFGGPPNHGHYDYWLAKFSATGDSLWSQVYGGSNWDQLQEMTVTHNNEIVMAGFSHSNDQQVTGNHGGIDAWVVVLGDVNTIKGNVFYDINKNGIKEANEGLFSDVKIAVQKRDIKQATVPWNGKYELSVDTGLYILSASSPLDYFQLQPSSVPVIFNTYFNTRTIDIAAQPIPGIRDVMVQVVPLTPARPGFNVQYKILYKNLGTDDITSASIKLVKDPRLIFKNALPAQQSLQNDTLTWSFPNLHYLDTGSIIINFTASPPPVLAFGDKLESVVTINPVAGDRTPLDNAVAFRQQVTGSYDPNDKMETNAGSLAKDDIVSGKYLTYTIRFQNTGTDTAFTVKVRDTLDAKLDWATLQMIDASHAYKMLIDDDNKLLWHFSDIQLVDSNTNEPGSHGYIVYRIKPKATLIEGDVIVNSASIYFDYNLPVKTNDDRTTVAAPMPSMPVVNGIVTTYCSNSGIQKGKIVNLPPSAGSITANVFLDNQPLSIAPDSTFSFDAGALTVGTHSVKVVYTNASGSRSATLLFNVQAPITPQVDLIATATTIFDPVAPVLVFASQAGGGASPLYTFARDRNFASVLQAEGISNMLVLYPSMLAIGDNKIYVRLKTSATCYAVPTDIDSILIRRDAATGILDPNNIGQVITVFPNPFSTTITLKGLNSGKKYGLVIYNVHGQIVHTGEVKNRQVVEIPASGIKPGVYWLTLYDDKKKALGTERIVKY